MGKIENIKTILLSATFIIATLLGTASCSNKQKPGDASANAPPIQPDTVEIRKGKQFLVSVARINMEEIKLGQLAQQKGTITDVKDMGKMMADDHTKAQNSLTTLALKKLITLPTTLDSAAQSDYQKLNDLSGNDFDKKYCDIMVKGHTVAIDLFEKQSVDAGDTDIRQMAIATLPTLQSHLNSALACQEECK